MESFIPLAKQANSAPAIKALVEQVLSNPQVFTFGELLAMRNIQGGDAKTLATLKLFAYGDYAKYHQNKSAYLELRPKMIRKLQLLTLVEVASYNPTLPYGQIHAACGLSGDLVAEVETLVLEAYGNQLMQVRIDQRAQLIHVLEVSGRDCEPARVSELVATLKTWESKQLKGTQMTFEKCQNNLDKSVSAHAMMNKEMQKLLDDKVGEGVAKTMGGVGIERA